MITLVSKLIMRSSASAPVGQVLYDAPGTVVWNCPAGVFSVCVVAIGGGGGGMYYTTGPHSMSGGAGGGLGWINNYTVIPGNNYALSVGGAGTSGAYSSGSTAGGNSYFNTLGTVSGSGGSPGRYNQTIPASTFTGDGGGNGGDVLMLPYPGDGPQGAGGAGGYTGSGGSGGYGYVQTHRPTNGAGGGGAGGGNLGGATTGFGGGGVGVFGAGTSGVVDPQYDGPGGGGSGGGSGSSQTGGSYGGGGGGGNMSVAGDGSSGAVRIIWGTGRSFPNTLTSDQ
jgi:hypothetical protein